MSGKAALRRGALARRDAIAGDTKRSKNARITKYLLDLPGFQTARLVLLYASFKSEADTLQLIRHCLMQGKRVSVPKVDRERVELLLYEIKSLEDLVTGYFGIPEPTASVDRLTRVQDMDLIIVPGVAFDPQCNRLGYGKGFYDKLLRLKRSPAIALAYEEQMVASIPAESHDIKMDGIITDKGILHRHG
jgi:5-formyltetrahydrofolate cyclo-ligase